MRMPPPPRIPGNPGLEVWCRRLTSTLEKSVRADILWRSGDSPDPRWEFTRTIIAGYSDATTVEVELDCATGKVLAGGGAVVLGSGGVNVDGTTSWANTHSLSFVNPSDDSVLGYIANLSTTFGAMYIINNQNGTTALSHQADMLIANLAAATYLSRIEIKNASGSTTTEIWLVADSDGTPTGQFAVDVSGSRRIDIQAGAHPAFLDGSGNAITLYRQADMTNTPAATADSTYGAQERDLINHLLVFEAEVKARFALMGIFLNAS
jgi:hypothetical protein